MIRIYINVKSPRTTKSRFSPKGPTTPNIRDVKLYNGDYEYVKTSSFAVLDAKLWLEEEGDLAEMILYVHSNSFSGKLKIDKEFYYLIHSYISNIANLRILHICDQQ